MSCIFDFGTQRIAKEGNYIINGNKSYPITETDTKTGKRFIFTNPLGKGMADFKGKRIYFNIAWKHVYNDCL